MIGALTKGPDYFLSAWVKKKTATERRAAHMAAGYWEGKCVEFVIVENGMAVEGLRSDTSGKRFLSGLPSIKRAAAKQTAAAGGASASPAAKKAKKLYFSDAQMFVLAVKISDQMFANGDRFSCKDDKDFYESAELQLLTHVKDINNKNVYQTIQEVLDAPAEVHIDMTTRVSTFVHTNLGRKWRKWLVSIDTSTPEKQKIALGMLRAVYYPEKGASSTVKPWASF